jgi:hypothetical protein
MKKPFYHDAPRMPHSVGMAGRSFFKLGEIDRMGKTAFLMPRTAWNAFREKG